MREPVMLPWWARGMVLLTPLGDRRGDVEADLGELFEDRRQRYGWFYARRRLCGDLLSLWRGARRGGTMLQDLRFGLRLVRKHPLPVGLTIAGLALAIAVATSVYSLVNATMLRPFGMDDPESIVGVGQSGHGTWPRWFYADFLEMRNAAKLSRVEASELDRVRVGTGASQDDAALHWAMFVSGGYLQMLGGRPATGRALVPSDDAPDAPAVAVVSHHFWTTALAGDRSIAGRVLRVNGTPVTIVGVLEREFTGPTDIRPALWVTFAAYDELMQARPFEPTTTTLVEAYGRLTPGMTMDAAEHELDAIVTRLSERRATAAHGSHAGVRLYRAASPIDLENPMEAYVALACLVAVLGLVLTLACANAANLLLAAAATRRREIGVRLAMGATKRRLIRQLLHESLLLGLIAGGLGLLFAIWLVPIMAALLGVSPEIDVLPDRQVLLFAVAVAIACGVGAGISPARFGARGDILSALKEGERRASRTAPARLRTSYVGFQAAVSTLLLVVAALLARTAIHMTRTEIGFDADRIVAVSLSLPRRDFSEPAYVQRALDAVRALPMVERVSVSQYQPFGGSVFRDHVTHGGRSLTLYTHLSDADLFVTMGMRLLRGRAFTTQEVDREAPVALISDSIARAFFGDADPIGRSVSLVPAQGGPQAPATVIGVVGDTFAGRLETQQLGTIYRPISRQRSNPPSLIVRTANPDAAARAIEDALRPLDPRARAQTSIVRDRIDAYLENKQRFAWFAGPTALLALILAALGIYGVTAFAVGQRTQEVSVRMAVGASAADVLRLLVRQSLRPIVIGLAIGLAAALGVSQVFASELSGISPHDPASIGLALAALLTVALIAVIVPARRAARTNPASVLRQV